MDLAAKGKQRAWRQPLDLPYTRYQELESNAVSIQDYALGIMPGLLQTADYAREVVLAVRRQWTPAEVSLVVEGRLIRQQLLKSENSPQYRAVIDEAVLHRMVGSPGVMRTQLQRLIEVSYLPAVDIRVIRFDAGPLPAGNNKFILLKFATPELPTLAFIEGLTGDLYLDKPQDVRVYSQTFAALTEMALPPDETRELVKSLIQYFGRLNK